MIRNKIEKIERVDISLGVIISFEADIKLKRDVDAWHSP